MTARTMASGARARFGQHIARDQVRSRPFDFVDWEAWRRFRPRRIAAGRSLPVRQFFLNPEVCPQGFPTVPRSFFDVVQ